MFGNAAPPASLSREESRGRSSLLSCYLPERARGGGERPRLDSAFQDTRRNHNFLKTLHLVELGGCSDKDGLRYIGSIRYALQLEPRSHWWDLRGLIRKKHQSPRGSQAATARLQPPSSPKVFLPAERPLPSPPPCYPAGSCSGESCWVWGWWCSRKITASRSASHRHPSRSASSCYCQNIPHLWR